MTADALRAANRRVFECMLEALGRKDWDAGFACMSADVVCDWPYPPVPGWPFEMRGRAVVRESFEVGQEPMAGLNYSIEQVYDQLDPELLIAEYSSHSRHLASGRPYGNKYVGILRFRDGEVVWWREYINPLAIVEAFADGPTAG